MSLQHHDVPPALRAEVPPVLSREPTRRPFRLTNTTTITTGQLHDHEYEAAVTVTEEGHTDGPLRPVSRACLDGQHNQCPGVNSAGATCTCEHHDDEDVTE